MRHLRLLLPLIIFFLSSPMSVNAQKPSKQDKDAWMKEMQQVKKDFIAKKLDLTSEQKIKFFPIYEKMEGEMRKCVAETARMARDVKSKGNNATDLEYEKAAEAMFEVKAKEGAIELKYYPEFKKVLSPRQLFKLKKAEKDFTKSLMKEFQNKKKPPKANGNDGKGKSNK